jgi:hypothetical protein
MSVAILGTMSMYIFVLDIGRSKHDKHQDQVNVVDYEKDLPIPFQVSVDTTFTTNIVSSNNSFFMNPEYLVDNYSLYHLKKINTFTYSSYDEVHSYSSITSDTKRDEADKDKDRINLMRKERGYKKQPLNADSYDLFQQIEEHFLRDDPYDTRVIRRVDEVLGTEAIHELTGIGLEKFSDEEDEEQFIIETEIHKTDGPNESDKSESDKNYESDEIKTKKINRIIYY